METARWEATWLEGPLVCFKLDRKAAGVVPDFDSFLKLCDELLVRPGRYGVVIDLEGSQANAMRRQKLARWATEHRAEVAAHVVAIGVVARGPMERGVLTAIMWVMRPQVPIGAFLTQLEALAWVREQIAGRNASAKAAHHRGA